MEMCLGAFSWRILFFLHWNVSILSFKQNDGKSPCSIPHIHWLIYRPMQFFFEFFYQHLSFFCCCSVCAIAIYWRWQRNWFLSQFAIVVCYLMCFFFGMKATFMSSFCNVCFFFLFTTRWKSTNRIEIQPTK